MSILNDRLTKTELAAIMILTVAASVTGGLLIGKESVYITAGLGIGVFIMIFLCAGKRQRQLRNISDRLDKIMHSMEHLSFDDCSEGELAILTSEIHKLTIVMKEQADKLEADKKRLTDAVSDIFHQLRTPLTSLNLQVSLLAKEELEYQDRRRIVKDMNRQLDRTRWLIEALLKMTKLDAGTVEFRKEDVRVSEMIEQSAAPFLIPMELRQTELKTDIKNEVFSGDIRWSAEAFGNLIKNCMEHTPQGGSIFVKAEENALYTEISVSDTGSGFDKEEIPYLFDRFFKGQGSGPDNVGIGLALARAIISSQNGTIVAENGDESGAKFVVRFYKSVV